MQIASLFFFKKKDLQKIQAFKTQNPPQDILILQIYNFKTDPEIGNTTQIFLLFQIQRALFSILHN